MIPSEREIAEGKAEAMRLFDEAQQLQLEGMIGMEITAMFDEAGFSHDMRLMDAYAALGGKQKVWTTARERALQKLSWSSCR